MGDRVDDDMRKVMVGKPVQHFTARPLSGDDSRCLEDLQMLTDQWLRYTQRIDEFMHTTLRFAQLQHDGDAYRCGQRAQQLAGGVENFPWRGCGEGRMPRRAAGAVLMMTD
ncbi:hypothetical protein MGAST_19850 [Mycobacterium gastri 'Wayne']|uniref:Uncharacterized protein n=1 Tax=Mycobacterium gastri TaxID=1777 RepID=A0A1X1VDW8_MYCGS|nr:hypothetical protein MGAST_19850 [Mycobacterium gastri 'Wayne']ORV67234.1 hypothetical protein AWC07_09475 [Mycobacterium gastri]